MVVVIKTGHSIHRIFNYNENKVKEGVAKCISAVNYPKDLEDLSLTNKLNRLLKQAALNENVSRNSIHISLNFDPSERLSKDRLKEISASYMEKIGFEEQPYLVYQHHDSGHPHIHIVTIKIRADGKRIETQNIGRNQSEKARKEIEIAYNLVKAENMKMKQYEMKPAYTQKVQYGKTDSRRAIANVLDAVLNIYKYTSLPELNAVLQQYNILADRGSEGSRVHLHQGLLYRILDEQGNNIGVPIKASSFYNKPTLKYLERRFTFNKTARQPHKARVKNAIDLVFLKKPDHSIQSLIKSLEKEGINTVLRQNSDGIIYGITYVDHRSKTVFNGSALGKQYSAKAIQERCRHKRELNPKREVNLFAKAPLVQQVLKQKAAINPVHNKEHAVAELSPLNIAASKVLNVLLQPEHSYDYLPYQLKKNSKKKKRKRISKHL